MRSVCSDICFTVVHRCYRSENGDKAQKVYDVHGSIPGNPTDALAAIDSGFVPVSCAIELLTNEEGILVARKGGLRKVEGNGTGNAEVERKRDSGDGGRHVKRG